ncbi:histidine phosphatase family protein [candidate division WOR-3 bacterium]|nr:histidine phosphatase family protein [candidate division WOR-3 bacterium]
MTSITFVRHGQSKANLEGRIQGQSESVLSELGVQQSRSLAFHFAKTGHVFDLVYSSPLQRALQTAIIVAKDLGLDIIQSDFIKEMNLGFWESKPIQDIQKENPLEFRNFNFRPDLFQIAGGETFECVQKRAVSFLNHVIDKHSGKKILVFSHGVLIRTASAWVKNIPIRNVWDLGKLENTALTKIIHDGNGFRLSEFGETPHSAFWEKEKICLN